MGLFRNFENTPATRICDPVKNETITLWLEETKRKKEAGGEEVVTKMPENFSLLQTILSDTRQSKSPMQPGGGYFLP